MSYDRIREIISQQMKIDEAQIKLDSNFKDDLGTDSLSIFEIIIAIEDEFNIEISNDEVERMNKVEDLVNYVDECLKQR